MKFTLKCPKCLNIFTFSEENDNYAFCECGWEFQLSEYLNDFATPSFEEVILDGKDETFDLIWKKIDNQVAEMRPKSGRTWVQDGMIKVANEYLKHLEENKFTSIPQDILDSLENFIKQIDLRKVRIYRKDHVSETKIGVIRVSGVDIPVYMGNYKEAQYQRNRIVIPYGDDLDKPHILDRIRYNVRHEIGHILDMKVLHPEFTAKDNEKYKELLAKPVLTDAEKALYSKFPVEVDATGTEFDSIIRYNFKNADYKSKLEIIEKIKKWLKYGGDDLPFFQPELVQAWRTRPTLYKKFQKRVYNLVQDLEELKGKENGTPD